MYKVKYNPTKCLMDNGYLKRNHKSETIIHICDTQFGYHKRCGCMEVIEQYRIVTTSKTKCPTCGHNIITRQKLIIGGKNVHKRRKN